MIVCCPDCQTRWRLDCRRYAGKRLTLRCARCRSIFQFQAPKKVFHKPPRVVVGHGDTEVAASIRDLLNAAGFRWVLGKSGEEVLALLRKTSPEVVLVDAALPGLPSFSLIEQIRKSKLTEAVKVLLLGTIYNRSAYRSAPTSLYGADSYLDTHRLAEDLILKIRQLLEGCGNQHVQATCGGACEQSS
ncbi:MAG TPA: hypothetical protein VJ955_08905 [Desulfuromonadales bacterium]|nr:hypothetical protein [Desulfuromonadales bacterium]